MTMRFIIYFILSLIVGSAPALAQTNYKIGADQVVIGNSTNANKTLKFDIGNGSSNPSFRANDSTATLQFTNDGTNFFDFETGTSSSNDLKNLGLSASVSGNALTIALKQSNGTSDPTAGAPVKIGFRSSTSTSGGYNQRNATAATSITVPSGATLGSGNGLAHSYYIYAIDNAGTVELAISMARFSDASVRSTTVLNTSSDSNSVIYSTSARTNVPTRIIGKVTITQATAGTWATSPSQVVLTPPGGFPPSYIYAFYQTNAGQSMTNNGDLRIDFEDRVDDTFNAVTTGASWVFTAPEDGLYQVIGNVSITFGSSVSVNFFRSRVRVSGSEFAIGPYSSATLPASAGATTSAPFFALVKLTAGQTVDIFTLQNSGAGRTLSTSGNENYIMITKVRELE